MEIRQAQEEPTAIGNVRPTDVPAAFNSGLPASTEMAELVEQVEVGIARQKRFIRRLAIIPALLAPTLIALLFLIRSRLGRDAFIEWISQPTILFIFLSVLFSAPTLIALSLKKQVKRLDSKAEQLSESQDITLVGPLIDLLSVDSLKIRKNSIEALTRLLPTLKPEDSRLISAWQRSRLLHYLNMNPEMFLYKDVQDFFKPARLEKEVNRRAIDFRVAILQSYANIGGAQELPTVRKLAANTLKTEAQIRLREAAENVLDLVVQRAELERTHGVLLRPTDGENASTNSLLRAAASSSDSDQASLLRPHESVE